MWMNTKLILLLVFATHYCVAAPRGRAQPKEDEDPDRFNIHYRHYLDEVSSLLQNDEEFMKHVHLMNGTSDTDQLSNNLEFASHHVRTKLDELKRYEMQRLRDLIVEQKHEITDALVGHVHHANLDGFDGRDLKKLIDQVHKHLKDYQEVRIKEFKEHEMQKEFEKQEKLNATTGEHHDRLQKEYEAMKAKHNDHEAVHEPGHKAQIEEVWEKQDHMEQKFDPKAFFMMHDLDSNGVWDENEIKALFVKELDKVYSEGHPEDDMMERMEDMEQMKDYLYKQVDANKDGFVTYEEFVMHVNREDYDHDAGWQGVDEQQNYNDEEFQEYIEKHKKPESHAGEAAENP